MTVLGMRLPIKNSSEGDASVAYRPRSLEIRRNMSGVIGQTKDTKKWRVRLCFPMNCSTDANRRRKTLTHHDLWTPAHVTGGARGRFAEYIAYFRRAASPLRPSSPS